MNELEKKVAELEKKVAELENEILTPAKKLHKIKLEILKEVFDGYMTNGAEHDKFIKNNKTEWIMMKHISSLTYDIFDYKYNTSGGQMWKNIYGFPDEQERLDYYCKAFKKACLFIKETCSDIEKGFA